MPRRLLLLIGLVLGGCPAPPRLAARRASRRGVVSPVAVGPAFTPPGGETVFARFVADRSRMHDWLYNGDDLWPKQVNLCARGRNALLDLDLGPGASFELGLFGPAWETHLYAVAVDRDPRRPWDGRGRTRLLTCWPVVTTGQTELLGLAHRLGRMATDPTLSRQERWRRSRRLRERLRLADFLRLRRPERGDRLQAAAAWATRLKIALLLRLEFSARALKLRVDDQALDDPVAYRRAASPLLPHTGAAGQRIKRLTAALTQAGRRRGWLFDAVRYRAFRSRHLVARLAAWPAPLSEDQLHALLAGVKAFRRRFERRFGAGSFARAAAAPAPRSWRRGRRLWRAARRQARLAREAHRELARILYIRSGRDHEGLRGARQRLGRRRLDEIRLRYVALEHELQAVRQRLTLLAKASLTPAALRLMRSALQKGRPPLIAGNFYFETTHLMETTSGFTHVGVVRRLPAPGTRKPLLYLLDRVLGFHYVYPVVRLTNSVPIQTLVLSRPRAGRRRRYRWIRFRVPQVFRLGPGQVSERVTLHNIFAHLKHLTARCQALRTTPGFYYAALTWAIHHPLNRLMLADLWIDRVHTGYGYQSLAPRRLDRLKGRTLHLPMLQVPGATWGPGCPRQSPGTATVPLP